MTEEDRKDLEGLVKEIEKRSQEKTFPDHRTQQFWGAVSSLIKCSDFGRKKAESELEIETEDPYKDLFGDKLDGIAMRYLIVSQELLSKFGEVAMEPYSSGLLTQTATVYFKPKK